MAKDKDLNKRTVAENRKARFAYEILDTIEAGLVLTGTEVKALRLGQANIQESYASSEGGEIWLINAYIPEYTEGNRFNHEPRRRRKLPRRTLRPRPNRASSGSTTARCASHNAGSKVTTPAART